MDPHTILSNFKNIFNNLDSVVRIDQQFGQKVNVFYRYMHDTFPETLPEGQFTTVPIPGANTTTAVNPGTQHLATATYVVSPTMLLNAGYAFSNGNIVSSAVGFLGSSQSPDIKPSLPYPNTVGVIPTVTVAGMTNLAGSVAYIDHGTNHQVFGDVTKMLHTHTFIAGFSYNHYQKLENNTTGTQGAFGFAQRQQPSPMFRSTTTPARTRRRASPTSSPATPTAASASFQEIPSPTSRLRSTRASRRTTGRRLRA